jgi:hypothetical protein
VKAISILCALALLTIIAGLAAGFSGGSTEDPTEAYASLVKAASEKNYGFLYDALDRDMQLAFDSLMAMSYRSRQTMDPVEKAFWDSVGTRPSREAFIAVMGRDPMATQGLAGSYNVVKVDTLVVLSIERNGVGELRYFSPEGGKLKVTSAPMAPESEGGQMPPEPPGMGDPHGGAMTPPDDSIHGGSRPGSATPPQGVPKGDRRR